MELAGIALKNNIYEFSDKTYKQIYGIAIGTNFAAPYTVLFMEILEENLKRNRVFGDGILTTYFLFGNMMKNLFKNLSMRVIHFIQLSNLRQAGQKKKLIF